MLKKAVCARLVRAGPVLARLTGLPEPPHLPLSAEKLRSGRRGD